MSAGSRTSRCPVSCAVRVNIAGEVDAGPTLGLNDQPIVHGACHVAHHLAKASQVRVGWLGERSAETANVEMEVRPLKAHKAKLADETPKLMMLFRAKTLLPPTLVQRRRRLGRSRRGG